MNGKIKVGVFGSKAVRQDSGPSIIRNYAERITQCIADNDEVEFFWSEDIAEIRSKADLIYIPQFAYKTTSMTEFLAVNFSQPIIFQIFNSDWNFGRKQREAIISKADVIWNHANNDKEALEQQKWFWLPFTTYDTEEFHRSNRNSRLLVIQSRNLEDDVRRKAFIDFLDKWNGEIIDFATRDSDSKLDRAGLLNHPKLNRVEMPDMQGFIEYDCVLEFQAKDQARQLGYWSDRQSNAVSYGARVATNYQDTLKNWESAISHDELLETQKIPPLVVDSLCADRLKWKMEKILLPIWLKTKEALL